MSKKKKLLIFIPLLVIIGFSLFITLLGAVSYYSNYSQYHLRQLQGWKNVTLMSFIIDRWQITYNSIVRGIPCRLQGGKLISGGAYPESGYVCNLPTSDCDKECFNSSECEGRCFAPSDSLIGEETNGYCSCWHIDRGMCFNIVADGVVTIECELGL